MSDVQTKIVVNRQQLSKFIDDPKTIKAFENLFKQTTETTVTDLEGVAIDASSSRASAEQALALIEELKQLIAVSPPEEKHGFATLDYIQFLNTYQRVKLPGQLHWSYTYGDLQFTHIGGLVQNIGVDTIVHVYNNTGATISKGEVVSFNGVSGDAIIIQKYIADGTIPALYIIGIAAEDINDGAYGHAIQGGYVRDFNASGSAYTETWANGDLLYASPSTAGGLTNVKPTAPNVCLPMATVLDNSSTVGDVYVRTTIEQPLHFGNFYDTTDKTAALANTAYGITFNSSSSLYGISLGSPTSRIVVSQSGLYEFSFSVQITSTSASTKTLWFWPRKNGTDIANSAMKVSVSGSNVTVSMSRSMFISMAANDYLEAYWATDDVNVTLESAPSTAFAPATPSVIMTVTQITQ